jgi:hypothetical protein
MPLGAVGATLGRLSGATLMITDFDAGVRLFSAYCSSGTSEFASGN